MQLRHLSVLKYTTAYSNFQPTMAPTKTLPLPLAALLPRQNSPPTVTVTVTPSPTTTVISGINTDNGGGNKNSNLDTGAIVGIVIGVVVAIILIIWAIRSLSGNTKKQAPPHSDRQGWYDDTHAPRQHRHRSRSHHSHHHHSRSRTPRPVVIEKDHYIPAQPPAAYVYPENARRSRSQRRRSRSQSHYDTY